MTTTAPSRSRGTTPPVMGIRMVRVADIDPHPKNPRRDLGDLTELTQSIQARGIRQNLTVVPTGDGRYVTVIGHRRLAAAKLAGLHDLPCDVDPDMSEAEQLEMMLLENLQRIDLTPIEEAEGYQDLLDLGVNVREICRTTGRSEKTVTARLRLLKLPDTVRAQVHTGQATLEDAARLDALADHPKELAKVAKSLGTSNFEWQLDVAKRGIEYSTVRDPIIAELRARKIRKASGYPEGNPFADLASVADLDQLGKLPAGTTYYLPAHDAAIRLYKPWSSRAAASTTAGSKTTAEKAAAKQAEEEWQARAATAISLRDQWMREFVARRKLSNPQKQTILDHSIPVITTNQLSCPNPAVTLKWLTGAGDYDTAKVRLDALGIDPVMRLLIWHHLATDELPSKWNPTVTTPMLADFYTLIGQLGYLISTAERELIGAPDAADQPADSQTAITDAEEPA